ncbi:GHKL domain-containing protein [bacterium]|nr:GHKL domain-containing protein [bacterium]
MTKAGTGAILMSRNGHVMIAEMKSKTDVQYFSPGEIILGIDGRPVSNIDDVEFILDTYHIGQKAEFLLQRDDMQISRSVELQPYNSTIYLISLFLVAPLFFILGLFVFMKRPPGDQAALIFHWLSISVSVYISTTFGRYTAFPFTAGFSLRAVYLAASALTPVLFLHLSFLFPRKVWNQFVGFIRIVYVAAGLYIIIAAVLFFNAVRPVSIPAFHRFMNTANTAGWLFTLCMIYGTVNFIYSYFSASEESERRKLRWVILGLAIAPLTFLILWQIPKLLSSVALVRGEVILLSIAFIPVTFAISIVRYHILNIDLIFNRSTVYALVFSILLFIYSFIVAVAALFISVFTIRASIAVSAVAAVIVALLFEPARRAMQHFVDKKFFRVRYNYRLAQREFSIEINRFVDLKSLAGFVVRKLDELMQPEQIGFFLLNHDPADWNLIASSHPDDVPADVKMELNRIAKGSRHPVMAIPACLEAGTPYAALKGPLFNNSRIGLVMSLRLPSGLNSGFLVLGRKKSHAVYSFEDIDLLKSVTVLTVSAIERISLQRDLLLKQEETQRLQELNRLKSYFVSSVSHDLQTPLTSIRMFAELLQTKSRLSEKERQEYLEIIGGESERLSRLISNVLNFSRIERGEKAYHFSRVNLNHIIDSVLRAMRYPIRQNGFNLAAQLPDHEIFLDADADAIAEMLINLLDNAMKYSREQKRIGLSVFTDQDQAVIEVSDQGIGISGKDQLSIFDPFFRSKDEKIRAMGGAGLGLTQVRHIVEAHQGKVVVKSKPGKGSTFSVFLPVGETE